jgi:hypothetical protein
MSSLRKHLVVLSICALIGAALNFPLALRSTTPPQGPLALPRLNLFGPAAAAHSYPASTPDDQPPWPPIDSYLESSNTFGHKRISTWSPDRDDPNKLNLSMHVDFYGWPLPVMLDQQMWWPWDHPKWQSKAIHDPGMRIHWPGALLNPLLFAAAVWALIFIPIFSAKGARSLINAQHARARRKRDLCPTCSYPLTPTNICPECGTTTTPPPVLPSP